MYAWRDLLTHAMTDGGTIGTLCELSSFDWIRLRSSLDAFLRHGPTGILAPSHNIVRTAVLEKYGGAGEESVPTRLVRRCVAAYFEGEHPTIDPNRRAVELPWARLKLRDGPGLARSLCNASVFQQMWYKQGEASRWQVLRYWHRTQRRRRMMRRRRRRRKSARRRRATRLATTSLLSTF